jgi:hypothetical protein
MWRRVDHSHRCENLKSYMNTSGPKVRNTWRCFTSAGQVFMACRWIKHRGYINNISLSLLNHHAMKM